MADYDPNHVEFERRVVPEDADHDYGFLGSFTDDDDTGRVHTIERLFKVYVDSGQDGDPDVVLEETHLVAQEPEEESRAGDAEQIDKTTRELPVDIDAEYEESAIHEWCQDWHESHLDVDFDLERSSK